MKSGIQISADDGPNQVPLTIPTAAASPASSSEARTKHPLRLMHDQDLET